MANENIQNRKGLPITVGSNQRRFSTNTETGVNDPGVPFGSQDRLPMPDDDLFQDQIRPRPDDDTDPINPDTGHNADGHHHHEHQHDDGDDLFSDETDEEAFDPADLIDIQNFQSENFYTNQITILDGLESKVLQVKNIGVDSQNTSETIERIGELLQQFPTQGDDSVLNLAIQPYYRDEEGRLTLIGVGPHDVPRRVTFMPNNTLGDTDAETLAGLDFPGYLEEFDTTIPRGVIDNADGLQWIQAARPDIDIFIQAYVFSQNDRIEDAVNLLNDYYINGGYKFSEVHPMHYNDYILGGREIPSANGNTSLLYTFSYYANFTNTTYSLSLSIPNEDGLEIGTHNFPRLQFKLIGPNVQYEELEEWQLPEEELILGCTDPNAVNYDENAEEDDGSCLYEGCTDPTADNYDPNANIPDGSCLYYGCADPAANNYDENVNVDDGSCTYDEEIPDDSEPVEDEELGDVLTDNYSTDEEISEGFGVPNVDIEQTIYKATDAYSGLDIDKTIFQNTNQGLLNSNQDGRIELGMFSFDDDNILQDNFLGNLQEPFTQYETFNLVPNSQGQFIKSIWQNKYGADNQARPESEYTRERFFIPSNNWGYCTYDAVQVQDQKRNESLYQGGDDYPDDDFWGSPIEDKTNGSEFISSFEQQDSDGTQDSQGVIGYAGYHAYFFDYKIGGGQPDQSLLRLQFNLETASKQTTKVFDECNKFFMQNQIDSLGKQDVPSNQIKAVSNHSSYINARKCTAVGNRSSDSGNSLPYMDTWFPNVAKWIIDSDFLFDWEQEVQCYSFGKCLEFLGTNFRDGAFDFNDNGTNDSTGHNFEWSSNTNMNVGAGGGVTENQYRGLNQVVKIYNPYANDEITRLNPFSVMEVKFKMKTLDLFVPDTEQYKGVMYDEDNPPQVEIAIVDGDGQTASPLRTKDRVEGSRNLPYAYSHGYWPHGDFNSQRYDADDNDEGTLNRKYSNFGSMGRFQNTEPNKWETFSYKFTLGEVFRYGTGTVRPLWLLVQAAGEFYGRVLLDDFEVYESGDFIPDVDVRKKLSVGKYGTADLTKYYDKELQPEEYKDSQGPLEAQFYFYPQHPSNELFDVKRTPVYQDFKKGKFYIYDIDWGDGSVNEFTSEPEPIDEETALYHTYESSGIFEITGTMIRMKVDQSGREVGILKNKKFKLKININEGMDEDFTYFGSDGFSFIPYKNTLPIIGGYSEQSIYYKAVKRQLGFISDNIKTQIKFDNNGDKLKTEIALDKMDSSFSEDLDLLNEYKIPREDTDGTIIYNGIKSYPSELGKSIGDSDVTNIKFYNKAMNMVELLGFQCDEFSEINIIQLNNPQNGANYRNHSESFPDIIPSDAQTGLELPEGTPGDTLTVIADTNSTTDGNHMRFGYRFEVSNTDIGYVDAGSSNLRVPTPILKAGKTYTFSTHIYIPDGYVMQGNGDQIQLGVIQTPGVNDWAAREDFLNSNFCCTEEDFVNNLCMYEGEERTNDDQISWGSSVQFSYYEGCYHNAGDENNALRESMGEYPKGMTYTTLDTAPVDENNQWYRMSATFTPLNPDEYGKYLSFRTIPYNLGRNLNVDPPEYNTNDQYFIFGAQIEEGNTMSPYTTEDIDFGDCLRYDANTPDNPRYWKNIIPQNYSIYNRVGIDLNTNPPVDIYVEQEWLDGYYYPVLPNYGLDGQFIEDNLTNDKIPFPLEAAITDEMETNENMLINITSDSFQSNVFNDNSGNENLGFGVVDYKPKFNNETSKPSKRRNTDSIRTSTNNGAF